MDISGCVWASVGVYGHQWACMDIIGHVWTSVGVYGHQWAYMDNDESPQCRNKMYNHNRLAREVTMLFGPLNWTT